MRIQLRAVGTTNDPRLNVIPVAVHRCLQFGYGFWKVIVACPPHIDCVWIFQSKTLSNLMSADEVLDMYLLSHAQRLVQVLA